MISEEIKLKNIMKFRKRKQVSTLDTNKKYL